MTGLKKGKWTAARAVVFRAGVAVGMLVDGYLRINLAKVTLIAGKRRASDNIDF